MTTCASHIANSRSREAQCWVPCNWPTTVRSTITLMDQPFADRCID